MIRSYNIQHIAVLPSNPHIHCSAILVIPALSNIILIPPTNITCYGSFHYVGFNYIAGFQMYFYLGCLIKKWLDKLDNRYAVLSLAVMSVLVEASGIVLQDDISSNPFFSSLFERLTACIVTVFIFAVSYFLSEYCDFPKWVQTIGRDSMPFYAMHVKAIIKNSTNKSSIL